jgi:hypothetical protein
MPPFLLISASAYLAPSTSLCAGQRIDHADLDRLLAESGDDERRGDDLAGAERCAGLEQCATAYRRVEL